MKKVIDLEIAKDKTDYFSPNSRACFHDTVTNELVFLNAREYITKFRSKCFYSESIFDFDTYMIKSMPKSERRFLK